MTADPADRSVGRFAVSASEEEVTRFVEALPGRSPSRNAVSAVPSTFPVAWLGRSDIRTALRSTLASLPGAKELVPVHLSQTITYDCALALGVSYWLDLRIFAPDDRGTLRVEALIFDAEQKRQARLLATLALVSAEPRA
jgi:hypothetical protein